MQVFISDLGQDCRMEKPHVAYVYEQRWVC